jgi:hypothetical protein
MEYWNSGIMGRNGIMEEWNVGILGENKKCLF